MNKSPNKPTIKNQLLHLEAEYRYLSQACYAWNKVVINPKKELTKSLDTEFAELSTIIQDSILLHTRNLLEFYKSESRNTDIQLKDLLENPSDTTKFCNYICNMNILQNLKRQIEVHTFHMTYNRDLDYRQNEDQAIRRPDFNKVNKEIFRHMMNLLEMLSKNVKVKFKPTIDNLITMSQQRYEKGSEVNWVMATTPTNLTSFNSVHQSNEGKFRECKINIK